MNYDYDVIILGAGAAGMTASIYTSRFKLKNLLIGDILGGTTTEAHKIFNWPGEPGISGFELMNKMSAHVKDSGGEIMSDTVIDIVKEADGFSIKTKSNKVITAKRLIITAGTKHRRLNLPREEELAGRGVSYCATCDALFFQNKRVALTGGGNSVISASLYLADIAEKVFVICRGVALKGEPLWREELLKRSNVTLIYNTNITRLIGQEKLEALELDQEYDGSNTLAVDGLFVEIGLVPQSDLAKKLGATIDEFGYILVNKDMSTNIEGLYAAGDSTNASNNFHQIVTACGEAAVAAESVYRSLSIAKQ
jgi:thioredoxin reductase (NADPH)